MGRKKAERPTRVATFRVDEEIYRDLQAVALGRGTDFSGLMNQIVRQARPALVKEQLDRQEEYLRKVAAGSRINRVLDSFQPEDRELARRLYDAARCFS